MIARQMLADDLSRARQRTLRLVDFDDDELGRQYDPLMSPLVWDLAHIGQQEELWLLRGGNLAAPGLLAPAVERLYDAFEHPRASRAHLPLLAPAEAHRYLKTVRAKAFDALDALPDEDDGFAFALTVSHECQHGETMLQALSLRSGEPLSLLMVDIDHFKQYNDHYGHLDGDACITEVAHGKHWLQQIPLGALIPVRVENLIPACKNLGVTHVTLGNRHFINF